MMECLVGLVRFNRTSCRWPVRTASGSEAESFSNMPERRATTPPIQAEPGLERSCGPFVPGGCQGRWPQAQSTAIARAMASICNDERGCFGVQGGHGGKTLSVSASQPVTVSARPETRNCRLNSSLVPHAHFFRCGRWRFLGADSIKTGTGEIDIGTRPRAGPQNAGFGEHPQS